MPRGLAVVLLILLLPSLTLADDYRVVPIHQLGTKATVVSGINDQGELVGASTGRHGISEAFVFTGLSFIPFAIEGAVETTPTGLSATRIVGSATDALFVVQGLVYDRATGEVRPLTTPDARALYAAGVNEAGDIVDHDVHPNTTVHGAILWANGDFTSIDIPRASMIRSKDINASGAVVASIWTRMASSTGLCG
jgi:hypothetical protein